MRYPRFEYSELFANIAVSPFSRKCQISNVNYFLNLLNHVAPIQYKHEKNDFAEKSKILLDIDLKIILDHQNNFVGILKIISNATKNLDVLAASLSVLHNYFNSSTKLFF